MNFDVTGVSEEDFLSVKGFVAGLSDGEPLHAGQLADLLIEQNLIGSCVKVFGEDPQDPPDVLGVLSMINLQQHDVRTLPLLLAPLPISPSFSSSALWLVVRVPACWLLGDFFSFVWWKCPGLCPSLFL